MLTRLTYLFFVVVSFQDSSEQRSCSAPVTDGTLFSVELLRSLEV
jgi:hypothetical protein